MLIKVTNEANEGYKVNRLRGAEKALQSYGKIKRSESLTDLLRLLGETELMGLQKYFHWKDRGKLGFLPMLGETMDLEAEIVRISGNIQDDSFQGVFENIRDRASDFNCGDSHVNFFAASLRPYPRRLFEGNVSRHLNTSWRVLASPYAYSREDGSVSVGFDIRKMQRLR